MNKGMSSGQKKTIIIVLGVVLAFFVGVLTTSTAAVISASSGKALPDYTKKDSSQPFGSDTNPFTILEIVPDVESAMVGYLIKGSEPGESDRLMRIGATDKNVEGTAANIYKNAFGSDDPTDDSKPSKVGKRRTSHLFVWDASTIDYVDFTTKYDEYQGMGTSGSDKGFSEFGYFTKVNSNVGSYVYNTTNQRFEPMAFDNKDLYEHFDWVSLGEFKHVGQGGVEQGAVPCTREMYSEDGQPRQFSYNNGSQGGAISGAVGDKAYNYYFTSIGDFQWVPNNNYNNENIFVENASDSAIKGAQIGDKIYMTRTEDVYYEYEANPVVSNDKLVKELLGNSQASALDFKMKVVTVTPSQLDVGDGNNSEAQKAKDIIDNADMIIIHDAATGYRIEYALKGEEVHGAPKFVNSNGGSGDLSTATVNYMIERGAGPNIVDYQTVYPAAIVVDDDAINTADSNNCKNLKLLCDVYNNLGAKLAYNLSGTNYSVKLNNMNNDNEYKAFYRNYNYANRGEYKDALGKSNFVYNFEGKDDSWLTTDFANNDKINNNNETSPAFENVGGGQTMSVAKMISAIYKESQGFNQPKELRLLELQPNEQFYYNKGDRDSWLKRYVSLFPWFIGTKKDVGDGDVNGNGDIKITKMPTYEFIGKNEDVNENYDMVIVGNKHQDETNGGSGQDGKVGYNDALPSQMAYTAVGDLVTTFGGDEMLEQNKEDDNSYKWNYGLLCNNVWSSSNNAKLPNGKWYSNTISFIDRWIAFVPVYVDVDVPYYEEPFHRPIVAGHGIGWPSGLFDGNGFYGVEETVLDLKIGSWWHTSDNPVGVNMYATKHGSDANMIGLRYSGNDLTKKKYDQLLDFSKQGPIIVADDLYSTQMGDSDNPNTNKIDRSSFVYQLAKKNGSAVNKYAHGVTDRLNIVKKDLEQYRCSAKFTSTTNSETGLPKEYIQTDRINYNTQKDDEGNNVLQYHFQLNGNNDSKYGVNVYTDSNGNGIFEGCINYYKEKSANNDSKEYDSEKSAGLIIYDETDKKIVSERELISNHTYLVTKGLPSSDVGMIPWKIEIYNRDNDSVRFSEIGYTRIPIPPNAEKTKISVLQMNLMPDMQDDAGGTTVNFADDSEVGRKFRNLTSGLEDFNIQVEFKKNSDWYRTYHNNREQWASDIMSYDMLVIGFKDVAYFTNDEDFIYGFEKFRDAGKAVILSHDLVQDTSIDIAGKNKIGGNFPMNYEETKVIQSDVRYYLRDISGQIRKYFDAENYNVTEPTGIDYDYMKYYSYGRRDLTFEPSENFKIFTSMLERLTTSFWDGNTIWLQVKDYNETPLIDKYTYTYGNFDDPNLQEYYGYIRHPLHREQAITKPIGVIRDYYRNHEYKPANMIMDNSVRSMLFYNYINYDYVDKYGNKTKNKDRNASFEGFKDRVDRKVENVDLNNLNSRRQLIWGSNSMLTNRVQAANEGQITKYPFDIPETIFVADTHAQNYQLDLEYDNDGDVLVWYNLAETGDRGGDSQVNSNSINVYDSKHQDSRNNYYIYTKNNITYTGLGHSTSSKSPMSDDEIKLFINTMVAAYRSSAAKPYINVLNTEAVNNGKVSNIYVDGDSAEIRFNIFDDTTNAKIKSSRKYNVTVKRDGEVIAGFPIVRNKDNREDPITVPVSFADVVATGSAEYIIELDSSYVDEFGKTINDEGLDDTRTVNVTIMPMFSLR